MKNISVEELNEILEKHEMWLKGEKGGERADLWNTDLRGFDLTDANLSGANLRKSDLGGATLMYADLKYADFKYTDLSAADLNDADLRGVDLTGADLSYTNLSDANLSNADLNDANLSYTNLSNADLSNADLSNTDLRYANLNNANLWGANLNYANLNNIETNMNTIGYNLACPEEGFFIGYKKANGCIVKLLILEDSKRSSATTAKCRCDKAKVLEITEIGTGKRVKRVSSNYDFDFIYEVGKIVSVEDFDDNRWNECGTGIHFFVNKANALNY